MATSPFPNQDVLVLVMFILVLPRFVPVYAHVRYQDFSIKHSRKKVQLIIQLRGRDLNSLSPQSLSVHLISYQSLHLLCSRFIIIAGCVLAQYMLA